MSEALEKIEKAKPRRFRPYPEYKHSSVEWLGEVPKHWDCPRMWRISTAMSGGTPTKGNPDYWNGDIPWVSPKDMKRWVIDGSEDTITERALKESGLRLLAPPVVLIVVRGMILAHSFPIAVTSVPVTINQDMKALTLSRDVDPFFFAWALSGLSHGIVTRVVEEAAHGTRAIRMDEWRNVIVPVPSKDDQRAITAFLDRETAKIDALLAKKERLIELLQEQRTALITHAVTRGLDPNAPMKHSGIEWLGEIPAHWETKKLSWITECLDGRRVPLNAAERGQMQGEYPYWGANSIVDYVDQWLFDEELVLLGEDGAPFFDRLRPVAFRVAGRIWVNNHTHVLRPKKSVDASFLAHALNCVDYRVFIGGSTRDKLTQGDMNGIPIQCPGLAEQQAIVEFLSAETARIDALTEKVLKAIDRLKEFRTALISAGVTGKIDVRGEAA